MATVNVALIVGVTGIVGNGLVQAMQKPGATGGPWKIFGTGRRPKPDWFDAEVEYVQCDLLNRQETMDKLSPLRPKVTHVFWATWTARSQGLEYLANDDEEHLVNVEMLRNLLDAVVVTGSSSSLEHVALTTGARHYLLRFGPVHPLPFVEDLPRGVEPGKEHRNWYFDQEDLVFEACSRRPGLTWSVHRPNIVFGFAPRNTANVLGDLAAYATLCKYLGLKFIYPGKPQAWKMVNNFSDSRIIAEQELWAATTEAAKNQAFNVVNGDVFTWEELWIAIAKQLKLETENYLSDGFSMFEFMKDKQDVWEKIVYENQLVETKLRDKWSFEGFSLQLLSSTEKCRKFGFTSSINTKEAVGHWIAKLMEKRVIPGQSFWT